MTKELTDKELLHEFKTMCGARLAIFTIKDRKSESANERFRQFQRAESQIRKLIEQSVTTNQQVEHSTKGKRK